MKLRFIVNLRSYNDLFHRPPYFSLPSFTDLLHMPNFADKCFIKLDIENCFWSLTLPPQVSGDFTTTRLPFGWSWSPILAQHLSGWTFLRLLCSNTLMTFYRLRKTHLLAYVTSYYRHLLTAGGFILNRAKCISTPATSLEWLGRHISTHEKHIYTNPQLPELLCANNWPFSIMSG